MRGALTVENGVIATLAVGRKDPLELSHHGLGLRDPVVTEVRLLVQGAAM